jgi:hypothetical protein
MLCSVNCDGHSLHTQILLVLSNKVLDILRENYSKDLRGLLGSDTTRLMQAACMSANTHTHAYLTQPEAYSNAATLSSVSNLTPISIAFECLQGFPMEKGVLKGEYD